MFKEMESVVDYRRLGQNIREARKAQNLTQMQFAEKIGMSWSYVGHIERGTRICSLETLIRVADALDMSVDQLLGRFRISDSEYTKVMLVRSELTKLLKYVNYMVSDRRKALFDEGKERS